jgi:vitamin B12/bleomycin/antimicrobial peptide transport system ATP-binding/permease protein
MSSSDKPAPAGATFIRFAAGYWKSPGAAAAWILTVVVLASLFAQIASQLGMNSWQRLFFDALERKDPSAVWAAVLWLPALLAFIAMSVSALVVSRMLLQVCWRAWVTDRLAGWWIADQRYYRMTFTAPDQGAPEYRIADDVRLAVEPLVEFALGLLAALITALTFAAVLWQVAGSATITVADISITIPAYMAFAAVIYAIVASLAAYFAGRPLVARVSAKNELEARFRAEMTRLRENAESIALIKGDRDELSATRQSLGAVVSAWVSIIRQQGVIAIVLNTNGALFPVLPLLLITPKYLQGEVTLGAVMQVVAAFSAVQGALIWFVDNFVRLAEWYASARRVEELRGALMDLDRGMVMEDDAMITIRPSADASIILENLSIADAGGRVVIQESTVRIAAGEKVMIKGESGSGKSTLIRAIAGLWPWGSGTIHLPENVPVAFVPQRPYIPLGSLRQALLYPHAEQTVADEAIAIAMKRCGLGYLVGKLDVPDVRWDQTLSGGERQRLAFCRLLLQRPLVIIMDEATSALDEDSQASLLSLLHNELAPATVVSVAHRAGVEEFHERSLHLKKRASGATISVQALPKSLWRLLQRLDAVSD